jgi:hypothetical protein
MMTVNFMLAAMHAAREQIEYPEVLMVYLKPGSWELMHFINCKVVDTDVFYKMTGDEQCLYLLFCGLSFNPYSSRSRGTFEV